jgi:hypothetical protein
MQTHSREDDMKTQEDGGQLQTKERGCHLDLRLVSFRMRRKLIFIV